MKLSHTFGFSLQLYNRRHAKNTIDAKSLKVTISKNVASVNDSFDMQKLIDTANVWEDFFNRTAVIRVDDPFIIQLLEPKAGATVHNYLNELKEQFTDTYNAIKIGTSVPPPTRNGYHVIVFGTKYDITLEGIGEYILRKTDTVDEIVLSDGSLTVTLNDSDYQ